MIEIGWAGDQAPPSRLLDVERAEHAIDPFFSVIVPVHNGEKVLPRCLEAIAGFAYPGFECIVVDDGSTDNSAEIARDFSCKVISIPDGPRGPSNARNIGVSAARGKIVVFIDADVVAPAETLSRMAEAFEREPGVAAVFGSYDDHPDQGSLLSQYKNLFHHYVHQTGKENASTFWSGCGAVRREVFLQMGGFDALRYPRPSIEDIELGYALISAGYEIRLIKEIQVNHLKRWSLPVLFKSDIFERGLPWTSLILRYRSLPDDLNVRRSQRVSAALCLAILAIAGLGAWYDWRLIGLPVLFIFYLCTVGYWDWYGERLLQAISPPALIIDLLLGALVIGMGIAWNSALIALPVIAILAAGGVQLTWKRAGKRTHQILLAVLLSSFAVASLQILWYESAFGIALIILGSLVAWLNRDFYRFFREKRGSLFAAVIYPFHLSYFWYSSFTLAVGFGQHLVNKMIARPRRQSSSINQAKTRV
jgi:glycosyltransferase involved in cell wall biosynthesis